MKYFKEHEFSCQCGCGKGYEDMDEDFLFKLDRARGIAGVPFKLNSAFRCWKHNKEVGGSENSSHPEGCAVDIACTNSYKRFKIITALLEVGFNRIGIDDKFLHCDDDPAKPKELIWVY